MSAAVPAVFLGTSDFAADVLRVLAASGQRPQLVVTPPDRRSGRGRKVSPPAAAVVAADPDGPHAKIYKDIAARVWADLQAKRGGAKAAPKIGVEN